MIVIVFSILPTLSLSALLSTASFTFLPVSHREMIVNPIQAPVAITANGAPAVATQTANNAADASPKATTPTKQPTAFHV